jgi:hypothetical protein
MADTPPVVDSAVVTPAALNPGVVGKIKVAGHDADSIGPITFSGLIADKAGATAPFTAPATLTDPLSIQLASLKCVRNDTGAVVPFTYSIDPSDPSGMTVVATPA